MSDYDYQQLLILGKKLEIPKYNSIRKEMLAEQIRDKLVNLADSDQIPKLWGEGEDPIECVLKDADLEDNEPADDRPRVLLVVHHDLDRAFFEDEHGEVVPFTITDDRGELREVKYMKLAGALGRGLTRKLKQMRQHAERMGFVITAKEDRIP